MVESDFETLNRLVGTGMLAIASADDELERDQFDLEFVRTLLERCKDNCAQAIALLSREP